MVGVLIPGTLALMAFALWLRLLPSQWARVGGVDAWFYLIYAEALRRQGRLPARVSHFLLDIEEQWYPPLFAVLLALLPERLRVRTREWVSPLIDGLQLLLLLSIVSLFAMGPTSILLAALIYATTPTLVYEYSTLNSRSLGSLVLTLCMLSLWGLVTQGGWQWIALGAFLGALLLLTHKMATQLFAFLVLALALIERRGDILGVGLLAVAGAFVLSGGFYLKVLHGHVDILRFWRKHLLDLGAHQVYDSPLYEDSRAPNHPVRRFYGAGIAGVWRLIRILIAHNPWPLLLPWLAWLYRGDQFGEFLLLWAGLGYAAVILTTFVPSLRFFGEGFKYLKFTVFPVAILIGRAFAGWPEALAAIPFLLLSGVAIWRFQRVRRFEVLDDDFQKIVAFLKADPRERVATIPCHPCDPLAYLAGKRVLWGAHSSGYDKLESWFPVIRQRVPDFLDANGVSLLLVDSQYVSPDDLRINGDFRRILEQGRFVLLERRSSREEAG